MNEWMNEWMNENPGVYKIETFGANSKTIWLTLYGISFFFGWCI